MRALLYVLALFSASHPIKNFIQELAINVGSLPHAATPST